MSAIQMADVVQVESYQCACFSGITNAGWYIVQGEIEMVVEERDQGPSKDGDHQMKSHLGTWPTEITIIKRMC
jgi:hypothetical protein